MSRFINREQELKFLEEKFKEGKQLIILYGRRRVGKTELIKKFCEGKEHIYFLADKRGTLLNAERFASIAAEHFNDVPPKVKNFDEFSVKKGKLGLIDGKKLMKYIFAI